MRLFLDSHKSAAPSHIGSFSRTSSTTFLIISRRLPVRLPLIRASIKSSEAAQSDQNLNADTKVAQDTPINAQSTTKAAPKPKKPVYSMKKGQIVRVDKEKYLNSVNVLDLRVFETGEYALIAWVGIPTAPAWLPTDMLIKSDKLDYERI